MSVDAESTRPKLIRITIILSHVPLATVLCDLIKIKPLKEINFKNFFKKVTSMTQRKELFYKIKLYIIYKFEIVQWVNH